MYQNKVVLGDCVLYLGDCLAVMKDMPDKSVDAVITDPPYGMNLDTKFSKRPLSKRAMDKHPVQRDYEPVIGDDAKFDPAPLLNKAKEVFLFGGDYFADSLPSGGSWIVWDKRDGLGDFDYSSSEFELCWSKQKHHRKIIRQRWFGLCGTESQDVKKRVHPTQKPIQVMKWLIENYTHEGDTILDPFMGSGTTGVACVQTGRNFIGIEIDAGYFKIAEKRIHDAQQQMRLPI